MNLELKYFLIYFMLSLFMCFILSVLSVQLTYKSPDKEKVSVYECGFNPFHSPGEPFSMKFFIMAILFLVFDLEVSLLFPWSANSNMMNLKGQLIIYLFLVVLILGLIYEWVKGGLEWE